MITNHTFKIHPFFYVVAIVCIVTGYFKFFLFFTFLILFHEIGHILAGLICNWKIDKIVIMPFSGLTIFDNKINHSLKEELFVVLLGPIFQLILGLFIKDYSLLNIHYSLLIFNLIPIYPLDGSKIFNIIFNNLFSFYKSLNIMIYLSYLMIFLILLKYKNILLVLIMLLILSKVIQEHKKIKEIFNKFLLERYLYNFNYKKTKKVTKLKQMSLCRKHLFNVENKWYTEKEILRKIFDK